MNTFTTSSGFLWTSLILLICLLAQKGSCRPNQDSDEYVNDENPNYEEEDDGEGDSDEPTPPPVIRTRPYVQNVRTGDTIYLPCDVENGDPYVIMWQNGSTTLFTDHVKQSSDPRLFIDRNNTLQISDVQPHDIGFYTCVVTANPTLQVTHTIKMPHFRLPAKILSVLPLPINSVIEKGSSVTLQCNVIGNPSPVVTWTRKGRNMPGNKKSLEGNTVTLNNIDRHHAGDYKCSATNGLGTPAQASVNIVVHYAPEIDVDVPVVISGTGYESDLTCTVHAVPRATVSWTRNGHQIRSLENFILKREGTKHTLHLVKTMVSDFGKYTCIANNSIGRSHKDVDLSGSPSEAHFVSGKMGADGRSQELEWTVKSFSPITKYTLLYRKANTDDAWQSLSPRVENGEGNMYVVKHTLVDLSTGEYEATLQSQNMVGLSSPSKAHNFSTHEVSEAAANKSIEENKDSNGAENTRPRIFALMTIISLSAFFL